MSNALKPFKILAASHQSFIEHLRELAPPSVAAVPDHNGFHSEIQRVVSPGDLWLIAAGIRFDRGLRLGK